MQVEVHVIISLLFFSHQVIIYFRNLKRVDRVVSDCFLLNYSLHFILSWILLWIIFTDVNPLWTFPLWLLQPPAFFMAHDTCFHSAHSAFFISTEENVFPTAKGTSKKTLQNFFSSVSFALELLCFLVYLYRAKIFVLRRDFIWAEEARLGRQIHYQPQNVNTNPRWTKHIPRKPLRVQLIIGPMEASTELLS